MDNTYKTTLLKFCKINTKDDWKKWAVLHHPDKGGDNDQYIMVKKDVEKFITNKKPATTSTVPEYTQSSTTSNTPKPTREPGWSQPSQSEKDDPLIQEFVRKQARSRNKEPDASQCHGHNTAVQNPLERPRRCANNKMPGADYCSHCIKLCRQSIVVDATKGWTRQCNLKPRTDDIYCHIHSTKPAVTHKVVRRRPCQHMITKNDVSRPCKKYAKGDDNYCYLHKKYHQQ